MSNRKQLTPFTGYFEKMTTPETIVAEGKTPKKRALVTVVTDDGQKAFFEVRDVVIARIQNLGLRLGDQIEIGFVFIGSEKNNKVYNNIFINQIDYVKSY